MEYRDEFFVVIRCPEVQDLMGIDGFYENSYRVNDESGLAKYGDSAYFVNVKWYNKWLLEMAVKKAMGILNHESDSQKNRQAD